MNYVGGSQTGDYSVFKTTRSWVEEEATWTNASNDQKWSNPGGDYESKAIAKVTSWPRSNGKTWVPFNVLAAVQDFVKNPSANFGFMIVNTKSTQEIDFVSSENSNTAQRPRLTITYDDATSVAEVKTPAWMGGKLKIRACGGRISLNGGDVSSVAAISVVRPDGKCLFSGRLDRGEEKLLTGLNDGVYFIFMRENDRFFATTLTSVR